MIICQALYLTDIAGRTCGMSGIAPGLPYCPLESLFESAFIFYVPVVTASDERDLAGPSVKAICKGISLLAPHASRDYGVAEHPDHRMIVTTTRAFQNSSFFIAVLLEELGPGIVASA
jgi:hypothetical protein